MDKIKTKGNDAGQRIDKFLAKEFFSYSRGEITRQIKEGNILVNGKKVKPGYVLKEKDDITSMINEQEPIINVVPNKNINLDIVYQDKNIIILNKPAGIQMHPDHNEKNNTIANALIARFPEIRNIGEDPLRPGIVHRLDKDTSGIIIIARSQKSFEELKRKFQKRDIEKKYWAVVLGKPDSQGIINKSLARSTNYRKQVIAGRKTKTKVRDAITHYQILKSGKSFSLLAVMPKTGRMHQIRVHMASIGHPIVGDKVYGRKVQNKSIKTSRQLLHAKSISFELFGKKYFFEVNLTEDMNEFLANID